MLITTRRQLAGFSLVELLVTTAVAAFVLLVGVRIYQQEGALYATANSQGGIQSAENAMSVWVAPVIRNAGFMGCSALSNGDMVTQSQLVGGVAPPLGNLNANATPSLNLPNSPPITNADWQQVNSSVMGYDAVAANDGSITITPNAPNASSAAKWQPALDPTLLMGGGAVDAAGNAVGPESGSDVLVVLGPPASGQPVTIRNLAPGVITLANASASSLAAFSTTPWLAISNCAKSAIVNFGGIAPNLNFAAGGGALTNVAGILNATTGLVGTGASSFQSPGASTLGGASTAPQAIPIQQNAFFVARDANGQSSLWMATLRLRNGNPGWLATQLIPGVENMQIQYGVSAPGGSTVQRYLDANAVNNLGAGGLGWGTVHAVRIGLLLSGQQGSGIKSNGNQLTYSVLGTTIKLPADSRMRQVFEMTVHLRNAS